MTGAFSTIVLEAPGQLSLYPARILDPLFSHLVPPAIMVWIFVWKYIFEPFIHILQHFVWQLSRSTNFCFYVQLPYVTRKGYNGMSLHVMEQPPIFFALAYRASDACIYQYDVFSLENAM
jgi:hypothetical protein